jgi:hypothetical protein
MPFFTSATTGGNSLADANELGSTWGLAYMRKTKMLYAATCLKRHVGILNNKLGMIYTQNMADTTQAPVAWLDVTTLGVNLGQAVVPTNVLRGLGGINTPAKDSLVFDLVGKAGFGDIDISADENTLYFVNLYDKKLYAIDIVSKTLKSGFPVTIPNACNSATGSVRPFGLKYFSNKLYIGTVCDAQTSQINGDLQANVYSYDGATMTNVLSFALNYPKGNPNLGLLETNKGWFPWTATWPNTDISIAQPSRGYTIIYPQPLLSDIEFDKDGDMILGFMDRFGHQSGAMNYGLGTGTGTKQFSSIVGGDILRADYTLGTYVLENNGRVGERITAGTNNNQGPGGGEYYIGESYTFTNSGGVITGHEENMLGGLAISWGSNRTIISVMDPKSFLTGGLNSLNNSTGARAASLQLYTTTYTTGSASTTFGKAAGIGDVETLCSTSPMEIGNYVWIDTDRDGVQDPCELPLPNVTVSLWKGATQIASTTTNSSGEYYFSSKYLLGATWTGTGTDTTLLTNTAYQLRISTTQTAITTPNYQLTTANNTTNSGNDQNDSDAALSGTNAVIAFTTGAAGSTNHTYDFGFFACPTITNPSTLQSICVDASGSNITVATNQNTASSIRFVQFTSDQMAGATPTATEAANIYAGTAIGSAVTPSGGASPYTATYTWNSADFPNTTNAAITYYVYAILSPDAGAGCRPTQEIQIMVSPTVTAGTATNPAPICQNGSGLATVDLFGQLVNEMTGGAWSQTAGTAVGTALNASTGSLNPNGLAVGTYTFTYTVTGISPCPNSTANVTITVQQCCPPKICLPIIVVRN